MSIPSTATTAAVTAITAGNPVANAPSSVQGTLTAISAGAPAAGPIGAVVSVVTSLLAPFIKGSTQHLSYNQVAPIAGTLQNAILPVLISAYGAESSWSPVVAPKAAALFNQAMQNNWGLGTSQNQAIQAEISKPGETVMQMIGFFVIWVGTNVDSSSSNSFALYFNSLFGYIFINAFMQAGYDPAKITLPPVATGGTMAGGVGFSSTGQQSSALTPYGPAVPSGLTAGLSGLSPLVLIIVVLGILGAIVFAKGKG